MEKEILYGIKIAKFYSKKFLSKGFDNFPKLVTLAYRFQHSGNGAARIMGSSREFGLLT